MAAMLLILWSLVSCCSFSLGQKIRLVNGAHDGQGRVEIEVDGEWGTVCDDRFASQEAMVVCRQLGFTDMSQSSAVFYPDYDSSIPIFLDELGCTGEEANLLECPHNGIKNHDCYSWEQVAVDCIAPGGTGCLADPPCEKDILDCPYNFTEVVAVPHRRCPICRCASCPEEPKCPEHCRSGETEYYRGVHCRRCRCVPHVLPDKIYEPNSISVVLLIVVVVVALGVPLVCLAIVLICRAQTLGPKNKPRQGKDKTGSKETSQPAAATADWFNGGGADNQPKLAVAVY